MRKIIFLCIIFSLFFLLNAKTISAFNCFSQKVLGEFIGQPGTGEIIGELENIEATNSEPKIEELENKVKMTVKKEEKNFIFHYLLARVYFVKGGYYLDIKDDKEKGKEYFELALASVEKSIELKKDFSDSYRVAADIYGWLIDLKFAPLYGAIYGSRAEKLLKKAIKYDSNNPEVYLAEGRKYFFTPVLFGGSKKKAIESFKQAIEICPTYYLSYIWLGQVYLQKGMIGEAEESYKKAIELEPRSEWAAREFEKIRNAKTK